MNDQNKEILIRLETLTPEQTQILLHAFLGKKKNDIKRTLFTSTMSDDRCYFIAIDEIISLLGGINAIEGLCDIMNETIYDTHILRKTVGIEPYQYDPQEIKIKRNML